MSIMIQILISIEYLIICLLIETQLLGIASDVELSFLMLEAAAD